MSSITQINFGYKKLLQSMFGIDDNNFVMEFRRYLIN